MDRNGRILDRHRSRLECSLDGPRWSQKNTYTWDEGRQDVKQFDGTLIDGRVEFDTPRLKGVAEDVNGRVITLSWTYAHEPENAYQEVITLIDDNHRARTWQHFERGEFVKLTVIDERRQN